LQLLKLGLLGSLGLRFFRMLQERRNKINNSRITFVGFNGLLELRLILILRLVLEIRILRVLDLIMRLRIRVFQ